MPRLSAVSLLFGAFLVPVASAAEGVKFPPPEKLPAVAELPDPLTGFDGKKITTKQEWESRRRPELKAIFEEYMYGKRPANPASVTGKVLFEDAKAFGGKGTLREVEITFGPDTHPKIYLLIATPNDRTSPVACFVGPNFNGNHTILADDRIRIPTAWTYKDKPGVVDNKATAAGRGKLPDAWPLETIIGKGYAVATFHAADIQPDRPNVREGMRATLPQRDGEAPGNETATVMWWAWGVSRAVDYLVTDKAIDPKRLAAVGHSRLGKTVLLAAAFDDRIALAIPHQAGCGGTGPSRHADPKAESVKRINTAFPHWFCGHFKAFNDATEKLPFDQHSLVAVVAPRPVLFTNAADDLWANPTGQFANLKAATPVYDLLGSEGLKADKVPAPGDPLVDSKLGYWIRPGKHEMNPDDWAIWFQFADKWLK
jgi:hypothetical protein